MGGLPNGWNLQRVEHPRGWFITKGKTCVWKTTQHTSNLERKQEEKYC